MNDSREFASWIGKAGDGKQQPLCIYSLNLRGGNEGDWMKIGSAYPHDDGKGFDLKLEVLPLNARLVLREPPETASENVDGRRSLAQQVDAFERAVIEQCLAETGGKISAVMERLSVPRRTLSEKMARLGVQRRRFVGMTAPNVADHSGSRNPPLHRSGTPEISASA
jgi:hypothetical protein